MSAVHDFSDSLAASHRASDLSIWEEIYRKSFPDFLAMVDHRQDGEHQRAGIDRSVILENSKQILIDGVRQVVDLSATQLRLPVIQLQQAWRRKGELWKASCFIVRAPNRGYTTLSAAVPVHELFSEIGRALRVPFAALETV